MRTSSTWRVCSLPSCEQPRLTHDPSRQPEADKRHRSTDLRHSRENKSVITVSGIDRALLGGRQARRRPAANSCLRFDVLPAAHTLDVHPVQFRHASTAASACFLHTQMGLWCPASIAPFWVADKQGEGQRRTRAYVLTCFCQCRVLALCDGRSLGHHAGLWRKQRHDGDVARPVVQPPFCRHPHPPFQSIPSLSGDSRAVRRRI